jgi:hypothetical protein
LNRIRTLLIICALALPVPAAIAGCGGDDSSEVDPQTVLDETFNNSTKISSGNLSLSLNGSVEGSQSGSFEASLDGPFQADPDKPGSIPELDLTGSLSGEAAGQSISFDGGLVVTENNAYVEYGGTAYEVGAQLFNRFKQAAAQSAKQQSGKGEGLSFTEAFKRGCEASIKQQGGDPSACDIDFESWLADLNSEGTEDIEGTETDHVSGTVDVDAMLGDLIALGSSLPQAAASTPSAEQIQQISDAISDASFDLYSATDDHTLRGLDFDLGIDPSQIPDAEDSGVESIDLSLSLRLGAVNEQQTISAPSGAKPLADLLRQFGIDPSSLGGLTGAGLTAPGGSAGWGGNADAAQNYLDCVAAAGNDPAEINKCASEAGF